MLARLILRVQSFRLFLSPSHCLFLLRVFSSSPASCLPAFNHFLACSSLGYYCGAGATTETPCNAGFYCGSAAFSAPSTLACTAGYYCPSASSSATQTACPLGGYCPAQATGPVPCTAGRFCPVTGMSAQPTQLCTSGYYCPTGSSSTVQIACDTVRKFTHGRFHSRLRETNRIFSALLFQVVSRANLNIFHVFVKCWHTALIIAGRRVSGGLGRAEHLPARPILPRTGAAWLAVIFVLCLAFGENKRVDWT
jgi:hypothetical protein